MPAKTTADKRRDHQREIDQIDLSIVQSILGIFDRDEMKQALADIQALEDQSDTEAKNRSPGADANALVANSYKPFVSIPLVAQNMKGLLERKLGIEPTAPAESGSIVPGAPILNPTE